MTTQTLQRANIDVICFSDKDPRDLAREYRQDARWARVNAATDTIKVSCGSFTVTFLCRDGEDDTRQFTLHNTLVGLGFYPTTLSVPDEVSDRSVPQTSYMVEWPRVVNIARGAFDMQTFDRSQPPVHRPVD